MNEQMSETVAIQELVTQWGYRDITSLIRSVNEQEDREFAYLCVLQEPDGSPVYCRTARRLWRRLSEARAEGHHYDTCPAPDPSRPENLWMVIGNFDCEDEDEDV